MASYVTLYAPFLLSDELLKLRDRPSAIINNRIQNSISEVIIRQSCSYMVGGIPYISLGAEGELTRDFGNRVLPRSLPLDSRTKKLVPHEWTNNAYRAFYSEILIENNYQIPTGKELLVQLMVIPAVHVTVKNGIVVSYSDALKYQIDIWKAESKRESWTLTDFFGTDQVKATPCTYDYRGYGGDGYPGYNINLYGSGSSYKGSLDFFEDLPRDINIKMALKPGTTLNDILTPSIGIESGRRQANLRKEGGYYSTTSSNTGSTNTPPVITSRPILGPLKGTAKPNWTVVITFPEEIIRVTTSDSRGNWECDYPRAYTSTELAQITATQQESPDLGLSQTTVQEATVQRSYGLPILDFVGANPYTSKVLNLAQANHKTTKYNLTSASSNIIFSKTGPRYALTSVYTGLVPYVNTKLDKTFLSYPGSIIQEFGAEVFVKTQLIEESSLVEYTEYPTYPTGMISVTAGLTPPVTHLNSLAMYWDSENLQDYRGRVKFIYEARYDPIVDILKIRWEENEDVRDYSQRLRFRWESEAVAWHYSDVSFVYEVMLPEERTYRDYTTFCWDKYLTQSFNNVVSLPYLQERSSFLTNKIEFSWEEVLIDPVLIQPFYVKLYDPLGRKYIDCVSFNIWGEVGKIGDLVLQDKLRFLFSNPPQYELIMFDFNLNPYSEVFLDRIDDINLTLKPSDIPEKYSLVSNITIKNINSSNSLSLDVIAEDKQLNEYKSYWIPFDLSSLQGNSILLEDGRSRAYPLKDVFKDDLHEDSVDLDLIMLDTEECCFTIKSVGSRCSPY